MERTLYSSSFLESKVFINLTSVLKQHKYFFFRFGRSFLIITFLSASAIIATFPFFLLALFKTKDSASPIFKFFLRYLLKVFLVLYFCKELAAKASSRDVDLLDSKSSPLVLNTLPPNRNELHSIFAFKSLTSLKGNSRGTGVTKSSANPSFLVLTQIISKLPFLN